jgi:hypothetical protein
MAPQQTPPFAADMWDVVGWHGMRLDEWQPPNPSVKKDLGFSRSASTVRNPQGDGRLSISAVASKCI